MKNGKQKKARKAAPKKIDPALQLKRLVKIMREVAPPQRRREITVATLEQHARELCQVAATLARARAAASALKQIGL
jgi:hypothetical protein